MSASMFAGVYTAIATPFRPGDLGIDHEALRVGVERQIDAGVAGIVPCGTTGEFFALTHDERRQLVEWTLEAVDGRVPVVAQTGALTTAEAVSLSRHAEQAGAMAILALPPFVTPLTRDSLLRYYTTLVEAVRSPVIYYHNPGVTGVSLDAGEMVELCSAAGIEHVKYTSSDASLMVELLLDYRDQIQLLPAWDHLTLIAFLSGARSSIWGAAAVVPEVCVRLLKTSVQGDLEDALETWRGAAPLFTAFGKLGYIPAVKAVSALLGQPIGPPRAPLEPLDSQHHPHLAGLLRDIGYEVDQRLLASSTA